MEKWLVLASVALTLVLSWVAWDASHPEWKQYQETYYKLALLRAQSEGQKEWAKGQRLEIKQLELKEIGVVERCVTCHLAVDNPTFRHAQEPFRMHSSLLKSHPSKRFGCVVCHGGEGRAVSTLEAHGQAGVLSKPLLRGDYMQVACYNCHGEKTLPPEAVPSVLQGRQLVNRYLCLGCHTINGEGGEEGPDLSSVGSARSWLWLYAHLAKPQAVVVGSTMPVFSLSREKIKDITIYLMTLLDSRDQLMNTPLGARRRVESYRRRGPQKGEAEEAVSFSGTKSEGTFQYDGEAFFHGEGCSLCHLIGKIGGEVGPALTYIARKRGTKELGRLLRDPEQVLPGGKMPQLYLNEQQIKALVTYLGTLQ
ncbi:MAG: c-type cytochrome [Candidatus Binatia bacterium]